MADADVKQLLLQVDATVELLRKELDKGQQKLTDFERFVARKTKETDKNFSRLGTGLTGVRKSIHQTQTSVIALGGSIATYFSGRELIGLLDSFTRFQNTLRVAGVEGANLKLVQDRLFESAQKYGVELETLAQLYSRASQAAGSLGASQSDLLKFTDNISAAVKVQGGDVQAASGALLQLSQALQAGTVRTEEYNSINEGLFPVLQAVAAGSDRFGGSVARLRAEVLAGTVTSREFFAAFQAGAPMLEERAAKATLTLSAGYTVLTNALMVYFGEADKANGVSAALGETLQLLADNLDTIVPALTVLIAAMGTRYVVAATSAAYSTLATSKALLVLQARMAGTAVSAQEMALALNPLKGGLITAAILALGGAVYYLWQEQRKAEQAARDMASGAAVAADFQRRLNAELEKDPSAKNAQNTNALAAAHRNAAKAAYEHADAELAVRQAQAERRLKLAQEGKREVTTVRYEQVGDTRARRRVEETSIETIPNTRGRGGGPLERAVKGAQQDVADIRTSRTNLKGEYLKSVTSAGNAGGTAPPASGGGKTSRGRTGSVGPSAADIADRFNDQLAGYAQQALSAQASMASSAQERAEYELRGVELARIRTIADIKANGAYFNAKTQEYTAMGDRLRLQVEEVAQLERDRVEFDKQRQLEQEARDIAADTYQAKADELQQQYDLTESRKEQARLALQMVDLAIKHQRQEYEAVLASKVATDAEKQRAQILLDGLDAVAAGRRTQAAEDHLSPGQQYLKDLSKEAANLGDAYENVAVRGLEKLNDNLSKSVKTALGLHGVLGDIVGDLIEIAIRQSIIGPLAGAIFGGGSGGGLLGSIFGGFRASGGPVEPGKAYVVGERRAELFVPRVPGNIVPSVPSSGQGGGAGDTINFVINAPGATAETVAMVRRELYAALPKFLDAARNVTVATITRPRLP